MLISCPFLQHAPVASRYFSMYVNITRMHCYLTRVLCTLFCVKMTRCYVLSRFHFYNTVSRAYFSVYVNIIRTVVQHACRTHVVPCQNVYILLSCIFTWLHPCIHAHACTFSCMPINIESLNTLVLNMCIEK